MPRILASDADRAAFADILQLEGLYPATFDRGDVEGWADLFSEDGVFDHLALGDYPGALITGRAELVQFARSIDQMWQGVHAPGVPGIEIDGDKAQAFVPFSWTGVRKGANGHVASRRVVGFYEVEYVRTSAGWRMSRRKETGTSYVTAEDFNLR